ncbi:efflux RND transporter periplasmic adaptor subunit [Sphingomonas morindae]|uniref:HlyD family secretion protein n=1 Tax=Sphingomonas morindae TaxID=1541170 RepID=A0ABY4XAP1_9SPHN|nr:HlyD family secretion protein [Sphingomonas morindae]USI73894.1 HlyD family secretion protein [Sphingomonas morindae]
MSRALPQIGRILVTLVFAAAAVGALISVWHRYQDYPWTRDGKLRADSVQVAADVSGLVTRVAVHDNQFVRAGQILFVVDKERYAAQMEQAAAAVARARASLVDAIRERQRYVALGDLVSREVRDQRVTAADIDRASVRQALADLRVARINLARSDVRARVDGYVTGFTLRPGDYVAAGSPRFALLDVDSYYVLGYFEETKLHGLRLGDQATITLLGDEQPIRGHVDSLSAGIADREDSGSAALLPNVNPTFSWVRLAQRVPVRIVIDQVPEGVRLVAGRTATVTIRPNAERVTPAGLPATPIHRANKAPLFRPSAPPRIAIGRVDLP